MDLAYLKMLVLTFALISITHGGVSPPIPSDRRMEYFFIANDNSGYKYGYDTGSGMYARQVGNANNEVVGQYAYPALNGQTVIVNYRAGEDGYIPEGYEKLIPNVKRSESQTKWQSDSHRQEINGNSATKQVTVDIPILSTIIQDYPIFPENPIFGGGDGNGDGNGGGNGDNNANNGAYSFQYSNTESSRMESADSNGNVKGQYSYTNNAGNHDLSYVAGPGIGFKPTGGSLAQPNGLSGQKLTKLFPVPQQGKQEGSNSFQTKVNTMDDSKMTDGNSATKQITIGEIPILSTIMQDFPTFPENPILSGGDGNGGGGGDGDNNRNNGAYSFQYSNPESSRKESADANGNVKGQYSYINNAGTHDLSYIAGPGIGFQPTGGSLAQPNGLNGQKLKLEGSNSFQTNTMDGSKLTDGNSATKQITIGEIPILSTIMQDFPTFPENPILSGGDGNGDGGGDGDNNRNNGAYSFQYSNPESSRKESADANGNVKGQYSYINNAGNHDLSYIAGPGIGFQPTGGSLAQPNGLNGQKLKLEGSNSFPTNTMDGLKLIDGNSATKQITIGDIPIISSIIPQDFPIFPENPILGGGDGNGDGGGDGDTNANNGAYSFHYSNPESSRTESADANGNIKGQYSYTNNAGNHDLSYIAGPGIGFQPTGGSLAQPNGLNGQKLKLEGSNSFPTNTMDGLKLIDGNSATKQITIGDIPIISSIIPQDFPIFPENPILGGGDGNGDGGGDGDTNANNGAYSFHYSNPESSRTESADANGNIKGQYSYTNNAGNHDLSYIAGPGIGFQPTGGSLAQPNGLNGQKLKLEGSNSFPTNAMDGTKLIDGKSATKQLTIGDIPIISSIIPQDFPIFPENPILGGGDGNGDGGGDGDTNGNNGAYSFHYSNPESSRTESADANGNVKGQYSYTNNAGNHDLSYIAGPGIGFQPTGGSLAQPNGLNGAKLPKQLPVPQQGKTEGSNSFQTKVNMMDGLKMSDGNNATKQLTVDIPILSTIIQQDFPIFPENPIFGGGDGDGDGGGDGDNNRNNGAFSFQFSNPESSRKESAGANKYAGNHDGLSSQQLTKQFPVALLPTVKVSQPIIPSFTSTSTSNSESKLYQPQPELQYFPRQQSNANSRISYISNDEVSVEKLLPPGGNHGKTGYVIRYRQ